MVLRSGRLLDRLLFGIGPGFFRLERHGGSAGHVQCLRCSTMALFHRASLSPTKQELLADWLPRQIWGPDEDTPVELIGSYRFDDPEGAVGMETFIALAGDTVLQIPLTYRNAPLDVPADGFVGTLNHSVLGQRWVYDGLRDSRYVLMLAAVALTGQGEGLGMSFHQGRWHAVPSNIRLTGGGWSLSPVPVDGFTLVAEDDVSAQLVNDTFTMTVFHRPRSAPQPELGLTATWIGQDTPMLLASMHQRSA